ncbi:MAG: phytanoyl-CoA dioxygenase family protein [Actinomycetota bacterium]|nr:phytanoyl-CoA dioxygenase family protein [Acidimicrobiales bacterium]MEC8920261.1 phytanoyl-CoA dioxygenase family protein [Actinomycetota bacterium]
MLTDRQVAEFWRDGVVTVPDAVNPTQLAALRADLDGWVEESRSHEEPWGETLDGRPRFDVQPGHSATRPALRRVAAPSEVSNAHYEVMVDSAMVDMVTALIGPDVKVHHSKVNTKLPGSATEVEWHQDFPYTPHSNTDLVTALLMVDEVTEENGPLEVAPGSHDGPLHSLWHDGTFTGAIAPDVASGLRRDAVRCTGEAGSVCLMHTKLAHGSAPNRSDRPRTLFICVYAAGDALPCGPSPVPTVHQGLFVRGFDSGRVRSVPYEVDMPELPIGASFFSQQEAAGT